MQAEMRRNAGSLRRLAQDSETFKAKMDSLRICFADLRDSQERSTADFAGQIAATNDTVRLSKTEIQSQMSNRTMFGLVLLLALLIIIVVITYYCSKKIRTGSSSIEEVRKAQDSLQRAQTSLQEESIKLDSKLVDIIEKQISNAPQETVDNALDHSLALKVADEIVRMEMNLSRMDSSVRGHKQLSKAVQRIKDNFKANGYDIVEMLGKPYNEGMKVVANFVVDENLDAGRQIITGITKPQINYNGKMIQAAQITVSQNI